MPVKRRVTNAGGYPYGSFGGHNLATFGAGGFVNPATGAGGAADKSEGGYFYPTGRLSRELLETIYVQSWACRKFIDIPIDDMMIRPRTFVEGETADIKKMMAGEEKYQSMKRLALAMKTGRLHGTGFLVMMTNEAALDTPLNMEDIRPGDLSSLRVFSRHRVSLDYQDIDLDPGSPTFEEPLRYRFTTRYGAQMLVDATRVLRFDGIPALESEGWSAYEREWGIPEIVPVILSITQDTAIAGAVAHLAEEASIPVYKLANFRDTLAGDNPDVDELTPDEIGQEINKNRTIYRSTFIDAEDDYIRVNVSFGGIADLMDRYAMRLAAAADIPATRFWGKSPVGMNATGDSDMLNYAIRVAALQKTMLTSPLNILDQMMKRNLGIPVDEIEYTWPSLLDLSQMDQATVAKLTAESIQIAVTTGLIDEAEGRAALNGDPVFGRLEELALATLRSRRSKLMGAETLSAAERPVAAPQRPAPRR